MARIEKTVFISYRRTDVYTALAVYENLKNQGYDVFFDYRSISSGDFEQIIRSNIRARAHFLLILTPTALDRCDEPDDWLRREIEFAIDEKRNIIPLFFRGFRFGNPSVTEKLTGRLKNLSRYNGLNVHEDYFDEAMQRLRTQYLNIPLDTVLHPVSTEVRKVVQEEKLAADHALEQMEDVRELVKQPEKTPDLPIAEPYPKQAVSAARNAEKRPVLNTHFNIPLIGGIVGGLFILSLLIWGASSLFSNLSAAPQPTSTLQASKTSTSKSPTAGTPESIIAPGPTLSIGSTMTGKDGMTLLYVPAGEFTMGSDTGFDDEKPVHDVTLDAFWIDKTEVTVQKYQLCVQEGVCQEPTSEKSFLQTSYYGNAEFDDYPVIYVDWNMAKTYCDWAERRLPTEAEWEKAARGENGNTYPWGSAPPDKNLLNSSGTDTTEVGRYSAGAGPYGAWDMAGNVWEWVSSVYQPYPYDATDGREDMDSSAARVLRGGAWNSEEDHIRASNRGNSLPNSADITFGFRCAVSAADQAGTSRIVPSTTPITADLPSGTLIEYHVLSGDTLAEIAAKFNSLPSNIIETNNLGNANALVVGQVLQIPVNLVTATPTSLPTSTRVIPTFTPTFVPSSTPVFTPTPIP